MNPQKKLQIGQVIFVFLPEKYQLIPFLVAEVNTARTLKGERTTYRVMHAQAQAKVYDLERILGADGQVFDSPKSAHAALTAQAQSTIEKLVADASEKAKAWYSHVAPAPATAPASAPFDPSELDGGEALAEDGSVMVEMPDGKAVKARITVPQTRT